MVSHSTTVGHFLIKAFSIVSATRIQRLEQKHNILYEDITMDLLIN